MKAHGQLAPERADSAVRLALKEIVAPSAATMGAGELWTVDDAATRVITVPRNA